MSGVSRGGILRERRRRPDIQLPKLYEVQMRRLTMKVDTRDTAANERRQEEIELLRDVRTSMEQIEAGQVISNRAAKLELRKRFAR